MTLSLDLCLSFSETGKGKAVCKKKVKIVSIQKVRCKKVVYDFF